MVVSTESVSNVVVMISEVVSWFIVGNGRGIIVVIVDSGEVNVVFIVLGSGDVNGVVVVVIDSGDVNAVVVFVDSAEVSVVI